MFFLLNPSTWWPCTALPKSQHCIPPCVPAHCPLPGCPLHSIFGVLCIARASQPPHPVLRYPTDIPTSVPTSCARFSRSNSRRRPHRGRPSPSATLPSPTARLDQLVRLRFHWVLLEAQVACPVSMCRNLSIKASCAQGGNSGRPNAHRLPAPES